MFRDTHATLKERIEWMRQMAWKGPNVRVLPFRDLSATDQRLRYLKTEWKPWLQSQGPRYQRAYWFFDRSLGYDLSNVYAIFGIRPGRKLEG